jgi:hypothetical protein
VGRFEPSIRPSAPHQNAPLQDHAGPICFHVSIIRSNTQTSSC